MWRRTYLLTAGTTMMALLAGCSGSGDGDEEYEEGASEAQADEGGSEDDSDGSGGDGGDSNEEEGGDGGEEEDQPDPEEVENREEGADVLEFGDLAIVEHEEEVEEREYGDDQLIISGVVENRDEDKYDYVFVGVRAYNEDGHQIDQYLDSTSDLQGGGTWAFEVTIYDEPAENISEWDIGVWGSQY